MSTSTERLHTAHTTTDDFSAATDYPRRMSDAEQTRRTPVSADSREELDRLVERDDRVLVDVYTDGCTLCQAIEPVLGTVAKVSDVTVVTFNPKHDLDAVTEWSVRSVPTLLLFEDGELVDRLAEGFQGAERILSFVEDDATRDDTAE